MAFLLVTPQDYGDPSRVGSPCQYPLPARTLWRPGRVVAWRHRRDAAANAYAGPAWNPHHWETDRCRFSSLPPGALTDRVGARRAFGVGLAVFVAASVACGLAPSLGALVAARFVQGAAAAVMTPASMALIGQAYPEPARRTRAVAAWATNVQSAPSQAGQRVARFDDLNAPNAGAVL